MPVKRLNEFDPLQARLISMIYTKVKDTPRDGAWRVFQSRMKFRNETYSVECEFRLEREFISFNGDIQISLADEGEQSLIILPPGVKIH